LESAVGTALDLLEGCRADLSVLSASEYKDALVQITRFLEALLRKCRN
jgi:octaprenyl-diphosphate synthase